MIARLDREVLVIDAEVRDGALGQLLQRSHDLGRDAVEDDDDGRERDSS